MKIAFIGTGNMGSALIKGVCKTTDPSEVVIYDVNMTKATALAQPIGCWIAGNESEAAANADYVVLAVKPQILRGVQETIMNMLESNYRADRRQILVSIAAGIDLASLSEIPLSNGVKLPVIRALPNTPAEVGQGLIIYTPNDLVTDDECLEFESLFSECGLVEMVNEDTLDAASAISGCTPAFAYMFIDALADGAVRCGVPRDMAIRYAAQVLKGSASMVLESGKHPGLLKDAVCSPGGSTIVGVAALEDSAFRAAAANAVYLANEKNKALGKKE